MRGPALSLLRGRSPLWLVALGAALVGTASLVPRAQAQGAGAPGNPPPASVVRTDPASGMTTLLAGRLTGPSPLDPEEIARAFLEDEAESLGLARRGVRLETVYVKSGAASRHVRFRQVVEGIPVLGAEVFVHLRLDGSIQLYEASCVPVPPGTDATFALEASEAAGAAAAALGIRGPLRAPAVAARILAPARGRLLAAYEVILAATEPLGDWDLVVDASDGSILRSANRLRFATAQGKIFNPNPVVTSGDTTLEDQGDRDQPVLTRQLQVVTLEDLDGSGYLRGTYADARNSYGRAQRSDGNYLYTRGDRHFEEVMFYQHVDRLQAWFDALGIRNANRRQQVADVHGTPADNSYYSPITKEITYGDGGVDDAEDADVLLHEYGHAIQDDQVPGWGESHESGAMGEGFGDWLASARFSDPAYPDFDLAVVADWDATYYSHENPPALRRVDTNKIYPDDMTGRVHEDGEIWSRALWDLRWSAGLDGAMQLVIESHFYCTPTSSFYEGALAVAAADDALFGGRYRWAIREAFVARGILKDSDLPPQGDEVLCRVGTVTSSKGTFQDVVTVNGSAGDGAERIVPVDGTSDVRLRIDPPGGQASARYVLYAWAALPEAGGVTPQPYGIGDLCFPGVVDGGSPGRIWNTWRHYGKVGVPDFPSDPAPWEASYTPAEIGLGSVLTLQGYVENLASTAQVSASVTNAVVLEVR